jgi:hypothetical protein
MSAGWCPDIRRSNLHPALEGQFRARQEDAMRTSLLLALLTLVVVAGCAMPPQSATPHQSAAPEAAGPKPDARFHITTTSISPGMGLSFADGRLGDNYIDYKFQVRAMTLNIDNDRFALSGQQVTFYGNVYHLQHVPDFAGTYKAATAEVTSAVGGSERSRAFQNENGVIVRLTGRYVPGEAGFGGWFDVRLLRDNFTITLKDF